MEAKLKNLVKAERCKSIVKLLNRRPGLKHSLLDKRKIYTPLHFAAKKGKGAALSCLLQAGCVTEAKAADVKGNVPLHLALLFALKDDRHDITYEELNEELVIPLLKAAPDVLDLKNNSGISVRELLASFDRILADRQNRRRRVPKGTEEQSIQYNLSSRGWEEKLAAEAEDEYMCSWGKFYDGSGDYGFDEEGRPETYDEWAERILRERAERRRVPSPEPKKKPKWTEEDQQQFLKEEKLRKEAKKLSRCETKRQKLYEKLQNTLEIDFLLDYESEELGTLILSELRHLESDRKLKSFKDLRIFWHPDKFLQKFGAKITGQKRALVSNLVTKVSQMVNTFVL